MSATPKLAPSSSGTAPSRPSSGIPTTASPSPARAGTGSCTSLAVPDSVKQAVTSAYGHQAQPNLVHITPVKGTFYYGRCGQVLYAATRFTLTSGATYAEQVALQDDGAAMKYFSAPMHGSWTFVNSDGFPAGSRGCAAIPQIPSQLAALWGDCLTRTAAE
ncbi:hypothetical protein NGB36_11560 [Streptomyces sp. RB6PN25]|uniref:Uncharacterized protein n=1 Tax=Streptomyces humicola TaxID=2953240 RepID=A0ABT1PU74_9ACTN|nr:hypothetical protein [Streptomyces humicola]MCQ4081219.1 hypothetical protein [Streptomyces humicola]